MTRPFFVDTDTASDDAVALVIALNHPDVEVVGIGVVAGNVPLDQAVQNALYTIELCGASVPVHAGADAPLSLPLTTGQNVHGADGMGDVGLPIGDRLPASDDAVAALIAASHAHAGELELVTLGPLTNIALALRRDPTLPQRIKRCVAMGAVADHFGNTNPVAEFNIWVDPHAAQEVLDSELDVELVGWDISRTYAVVDDAAAARLRRLGTPLAEFVVDIQAGVREYCRDTTKLEGFDLPDPIAMAYAIDPAIAIESERRHCAVETESALTRGMVVMDRWGYGDDEPNALVVTAADRHLFLQMLEAAVSAPVGTGG